MILYWYYSAHVMFLLLSRLLHILSPSIMHDLRLSHLNKDYLLTLGRRPVQTQKRRSAARERRQTAVYTTCTRAYPRRHAQTRAYPLAFIVMEFTESTDDSNISSTRPHNMVNFGPLAAEILSLVWGTPGNFSGFRVLPALLHGISVVGVS